MDKYSLIQLATLTVDFGMLVLIWLVQLVIYPSLASMTTATLREWHPMYTRKVTYIVLPLMLSQAVLAVLWLHYVGGLHSIIHTILIAVAWLITFGISVPLHNSIEDSTNPALSVIRLISTNWYRTFLWSTAFLVSVLAFWT